MPLYVAPIIGDGTAANPFDVAAEHPGRGTLFFEARARCLVWAPDPLTIPGATKLADDRFENMAALSKTRLANALSLTLDAATVPDMLGELLTQHAREDGTRWRGLRPTRAGKLEVWMGDRVVWSRDVTPPSGTTGYTESWPTVSTTISTGQDMAWAEDAGDLEVASGSPNYLRLTGAGTGRARSTTLVDTDNNEHICTGILIVPTTSINTAIIGCRQANASTQTRYQMQARRTTSAGNRRLQRVITGTITNLYNDSTDPGGTAQTISCKADGTSITGVIGGFSTTQTDANIASGTACMIELTADVAADDVKVYSHTFQDVGFVAGGARSGYYHAYYVPMLVGTH